MKVVDCLKMIVSKPITYDISFPLRNQVLLLKRQVKYVEDIVVTRDMAGVVTAKKEVIQDIEDIV